MTQLFGPERKPWEDAADGRLAPSSYAAVAVFGIVELAVEHLHTRYLPTSPANVGEVTRTLARVLIKVQTELGEPGYGWASSLNTRLRGALRTAINVVPERTIGDPDSMSVWEEDLHDLVVSIARTAAWLYAKNPQEI